MLAALFVTAGAGASASDVFSYKKIFSASQSPAPSSETKIENQAGGKPQEEAEHGASMSPLFFVIIALIIGAAAKHFLRKSPLPYTVTLLIIGLLIDMPATWFTNAGLLRKWMERRA